MDKIKAWEDLIDIKKVLDKLKIPFFLNYGTLLGAVRDKDFIDGDEDVDIGIFGNEKREEILEALYKKGFYKREGKDDSNICVNRNVLIDIHLFKERKNDYVDGLSHLFIPKKFDKLKRIKFKGVYFLAPNPTEEYLEFCYGNWQLKTSI